MSVSPHGAHLVARAPYSLLTHSAAESSGIPVRVGPGSEWAASRAARAGSGSCTVTAFRPAIVRPPEEETERDAMALDVFELTDAGWARHDFYMRLAMVV